LLTLIAGQDVEWIPDPDHLNDPSQGRWQIAQPKLRRTA